MVVFPSLPPGPKPIPPRRSPVALRSLSLAELPPTPSRGRIPQEIQLQPAGPPSPCPPPEPTPSSSPMAAPAKRTRSPSMRQDLAPQDSSLIPTLVFALPALLEPSPTLVTPPHAPCALQGPITPPRAPLRATHALQTLSLVELLVHARTVP